MYAGNLTMKLFTTRLMKHFGFRRIPVVNGALNTLAFAEMPWAELSTARTLFSTASQLALGMGMAHAPLPRQGLRPHSTLRIMPYAISSGDGICQSTRFIDQG